MSGAISVQVCHLAEERYPAKPTNKEYLELDNSLLLLDLEKVKRTSDFLIYPDIGLKFTISPFWCLDGSCWRSGSRGSSS